MKLISERLNLGVNDFNIIRGDNIQGIVREDDKDYIYILRLELVETTELAPEEYRDLQIIGIEADGKDIEYQLGQLIGIASGGEYSPVCYFIGFKPESKIITEIPTGLRIVR